MKRISMLVLMFVAILSGCATNHTNHIDWGDPNRPLTPQPTVPADIKAQLVGKPLKSFKVYTGNVVYYDASSLVEKAEKGEEWGGKGSSFINDFPKMSTPSTETVVAAYRFIKAFRARLQEEGYSVVDEPCAQCLRLDADFATVTIKPNHVNNVILIFVRTRVFFDNKEVLASGDDMMGGVKQGLFFASDEEAKDRAAHNASLVAEKQLERAWAISIQGQKISMN